MMSDACYWARLRLDTFHRTIFGTPSSLRGYFILFRRCISSSAESSERFEMKLTNRKLMHQGECSGLLETMEGVLYCMYRLL